MEGLDSQMSFFSKYIRDVRFTYLRIFDLF